VEVSDQFHAMATLLLGKEASVHIGEDSDWTPESVWTQWQREKFLAAAGDQTPDHLAHSPVAILTNLSWLLIKHHGLVKVECFYWKVL